MSKANKDTERYSPDRPVSTQLKEKARDVGHDIGDMAHIVSGASADAVTSAGTAAREMVDTGRKKAEKLEKSIEDEIREHPIRSIAIAAGIGVLAGIFWRR